MQVALEHGYKVSKVYKALVYQKHPDLFKTNIRKFLKIKLEGSVIPGHIDWETFAKRAKPNMEDDFQNKKVAVAAFVAAYGRRSITEYFATRQIL